ncbi:Squalene synthase [Leucoagaricus sp. SymC.cos]|nr:Squalene synthase [Leucoagaricus sp. SymC.cos]
MGVTRWLALLIFHPFEFRTLLQFYLYHEQKRDIKALKEHPTSGWDRESMRRCWEFLDKTSRSFSAVIKELEGDLARTICLFYLVLRGLDTIEDDMTIPDDVKQPILRKFHEHVVTPGWNFDGNGPDEKDRQLLVEYDVVVEEVNRLLPSYKDIIIDICQKMETGMADYAHKAATTGSIYLSTVAEYDLYCHYAAGLVGEGLSRLFSASGKEADWLGEELGLSNSMGLLLQKTNIIRDYREDTDEKRYFWPQEIWGKYGFKEMKEMYEPASLERAQWVQSEMILDGLRHATDGLDYLRCLKNQAVFNFCAIPATMAIATLELCFMNPEMFQRNIKIRKATAAQLIMRSTNPRDVGLIFREHAHKIHAKAVPSDPNFIRISIACGKIEQWYEQNYPSFIQPPSGMGTEPTFDPSDARTIIANLETEFNGELAGRKRMIEFAKGDRKLAMSRVDVGKANGKFSTAQAQGAGEQVSMATMMMYVTAAFTLLIALGLGAAYGVIWLTGSSL